MIAADLAAMKRLHQIGSLCARGQTSVPECLEQILDAAIEFTAGDKGNVQLFDTKSNALTIAAQRGFEAPFLRFFATLGDNPAACGTPLRANDRIIVEDVMHSDIFAGSEAREVLLSAGVRAVQSSPLLSSTGNVLGMISTHYAHPSGQTTASSGCSIYWRAQQRTFCNASRRRRSCASGLMSLLL